MLERKVVIMRRIILGTFLVTIALIAAGSGFDNRGNKLVSDLDVPKAEAQIRGPAATLSPLQREKITLKQDGLCYHKTTAGEAWDDPEELGYEVTDPVYELFAFEQEFDENGNAKYTDIVVPKEIDGAPVIDCNSFVDHYEIKSLRIKAVYDDWRDYSTRPEEDDIMFSRVAGCSSMEYFEMPDYMRSVSLEDMMGCRSLKTLAVSKNVDIIGESAFRDCKNLQTIKFKKFSNLRILDGLKELSWWMNRHTQKNGMVIYKKCLVDIGKCKGTVTIRGNKVNKIMPDAFAYSKVSTIKVINVKELGEGAFADSNAQKIVLGKTISAIPSASFVWNNKLKEIHILSKQKIIWGKNKYGKFEGLDLTYLESPKIDVYIHSDKIHTPSLKKWECGKNITVHVPKKVMAKYRKYTKCKVVAL